MNNHARYAHTLEGCPESEWQTLDAHLSAVAGMAREFAAVFGAGDWGEAAGWLHDAGKVNPAFLEYLRASVRAKAEGRRGPRGSVPHACHGAKLADGKYGKLGRLLAYVIAGHHGGLRDSGELGFLLDDCPALPEARPLVDSLPELGPPPFGKVKENEAGFACGFFTRMLFSCLVDADWLDTEAFMDPERARWRAGLPSLGVLAGRFFPRLAEMNERAPATPVNRIRREVLDACLSASDLPPGLFSLTVPTGGGKTLSSLAFALRHAVRHGLDRIIYVIPYMSIIEQNADVFRRFLGDDAVVEHHSSVEPPEKDGWDVEEGSADAEAAARARRSRLATENWDAPLVATTAVQFFESLFAAKPSRCRKLHNLARSVIILDEAQTIPQPFLKPCLAALRELAARYGATVILCTATQPAVNAREDFKAGLAGVREIVPDPVRLHERLRRVTVENLGVLDDAGLAERLRGARQVLCVVNTRGHARKLYEALAAGGEDGLFHLSATMTAAHRSRTIEDIRTALKEGRPCRVVSTQLVEAGVDLDFPVVFRSATGLDSLAQAAGRCDREGRLTAAAGAPAGRVYLFTPADGLPRGVFRITAGKAAEVLRQPETTDPLSPQAVERYFRLLFWQASTGQGSGRGDELDAKDICHRLTESARSLNFPFRSVAKDFRIIDDFMRPVLIPPLPWEERADLEAAARFRALIAEVEHAPSPSLALRGLQRRMVQISPKAWNGLLDAGATRLVLDGLAVLENVHLYHEDVGLRPEEPTAMAAEDIII